MGTLWSCSRPFRYINSQWKILKQILLLQPCAKINLEFAAKVIHGPVLPDAVMKTRIRRLYDIANILQSLKLIKKVQVTETNGGKKPAFEYTGPNVKSMGKIMKVIVIKVHYCLTVWGFWKKLLFDLSPKWRKLCHSDLNLLNWIEYFILRAFIINIL